MKGAMAIGAGFAYLIVNDKAQKAEYMMHLAVLFIALLGGVTLFNMVSHYLAKRNHAGTEKSILKQIWWDSDFYMFCTVVVMTAAYIYIPFFTEIITVQ